MSQDIFADLKGPKGKYNLHYGWVIPALKHKDPKREEKNVYKENYHELK